MYIRPVTHVAVILTGIAVISIRDMVIYVRLLAVPPFIIVSIIDVINALLLSIITMLFGTVTLYTRTDPSETRALLAAGC